MSARDELFGMLGYNSLLNLRGSVSDVALEPKKKYIEKAQKHLLHQASEGEE